MSDSFEIGNNAIMFIRVNNRLYSIKDVAFVQIDPNTSKITQDIPLAKLINKLMWYNNQTFEQPNQDWRKMAIDKKNIP